LWWWNHHKEKNSRLDNPSSPQVLTSESTCKRPGMWRGFWRWRPRWRRLWRSRWTWKTMSQRNWNRCSRDSKCISCSWTHPTTRRIFINNIIHNQNHFHYLRNCQVS
jgi:hypothetical protein